MGEEGCRILSEGLRFDFHTVPGQYMEDNNRSALNNIDLVRAKLADWLASDFVQELAEPAVCTSPLLVVLKYNLVSDKIKERVVLYLSRHVNKFINCKKIQLDDLAVSEHMLEPNDFMSSFDLKQQFLQVRLHPEMYKYFGFAVVDAAGRRRYFCFKVLIFGCKPAVRIVTQLLRPVKTFLHRAGVKISIYIDDGRIAAATAEETRAKTRMALLVIQLCSWNIQ